MTISLDPSTGLEVATEAVARAMRAGADAVKVQHGYADQFEVNFDTHDVTLVRSTISDSLAITVYSDTSKGTAQLNGRSHDEVDAGVAQALEAARAGSPDPANVLPEVPTDPALSYGDDEPDEEAIVSAVLAHIRRVNDEYPLLRTESSMYRFTTRWSSYANSHGRTQQARRALHGFQVMVTGKDGDRATSFNYADMTSATQLQDLTDIPAIRLVLASTVDSFDPKPVPETFVGDVIFTPETLGDVVESMADALSGMSILRKTTPFLDSLGASIAAPAFNLLHRPSALDGASPYDGEGFVNRDLDVVRDGVLANFLVDWYTAHKLDRPMTTGCLDLVVSPGETSLDDIIADTERGIVLGRFSGGMPNANLDFSGVAKNSFFVENGKIVGPITETMISGNFRGVLENIRAISRETIHSGTWEFPWLATGGITVSTK